MPGSGMSVSRRAAVLRREGAAASSSRDAPQPAASAFRGAPQPATKASVSSGAPQPASEASASCGASQPASCELARARPALGRSGLQWAWSGLESIPVF